jgi:two-component system, OmpR family, phosphate regulon sensor histidine kinase PhoR
MNEYICRMVFKTPKQFSVFLAFAVGLFSILAEVIVNLSFGLELHFLVLVLQFLIIGVSGYFIIYTLLTRMITDKIKVLYRTIHSFKINKGDFNLNMNEDVLGATEKEVMSWVSSRKAEINKLKEQEAFRREFIGNLAHELRTPVFSIQGYILTLLEGGLEDENINRKFLERAAKGVDRMTNILEDLDAITKLESERIKLNLKKVDIVDIADEIIESFELKAQERSIKLILDKKNVEPIFVMCDRDKIGQVFTNLINNAINYGKENGKIKVRFFDFEDHILIEVSDDGIGIAKEHLDRLFERFYRVDKSRSRNDGGTGLGLAIAKHILEAHEQMINVRSTLGEGSTFSFTLKKAKKDKI